MTTPNGTIAEQITAMTGEQLYDLVDALGESGRDRLTNAIRAVATNGNEALILEEVRALIESAGLKDVTWVVFRAEEWDNGYFLSHWGNVYDKDGAVDRLEFEVEDQLTAEFGTVGGSFAYAVNPTTGETYSDDYDTEVYGHIGVKLADG